MAETHKILRYVLNDFEDLKPIEQGGGGIISTGKLEDFGRIALKQFICSKERPLEKYKKEIDILIEYKHPNIVHLYGILWDGIDTSRYLVIHDSTKVYGKVQIYVWIEQIARGLQFLHKHGIIHRDIKPDNILVYGDQLKLADFGIAKNANGTTTAGGGTYCYMSPEMLNYGKCSSASDIYSLGITIWELTHRKIPYSDLEQVSGYIFILSKIISGTRPAITPDKADEDVRKLIERCWQENINSRPSIKEIVDYFETKGGTSSQIAKRSEYLRTIGGQEEYPSEETESKTIIILGGYREDSEENIEASEKNVAVLSSDRSKWIGVECDILDINDVAVVYLNDDIYIIGSCKEIRKLDKNLKLRRLADMDVDRSGIKNSCLAWNGYIWVLGGQTLNGQRLRSVERYDPTYGRWTSMPDMKYCRSRASATIWNDRIIISGGTVSNMVDTNTVECYNPEDGHWTILPKMPHRLFDHYLISYGDKLLIIGGDNCKTTYNNVWQLDPQEKSPKWEPLMSMGAASSNFVAAALDNEVYAIGGSRALYSDYLDRVEIFDGEHWRDGPSLPLEWHGMSYAVIPQSLADRICAYKSLKDSIE